MKDPKPEPLVFECELPQGPDKVWKALTVPELLASWLLPNDIRPVQGARFSFEGGGPEGAAGGRIECEVLKVEPQRLLRYSWRSGETGSTAGGDPLDSVVTFELLPTVRGGTLLRLIHDGFPVDLGAMAHWLKSPVARYGPAISAEVGAACYLAPDKRRDFCPVVTLCGGNSAAGFRRAA